MSLQSPNNNRSVRWRLLLRWKNGLNHDYKNNHGRNFQFTKFSFIDFVLTDRRVLSGKRPKSASSKSSSCRFSFSAERNANTKATEYVAFGFSVWILWFSFPSRKVWTSLSVSDTDYFSVFAVITRESSDKLLVLRIVKALPFIHQPDRVTPKASDVKLIGYINTYKKISYFSTCVVTAFLRAGNPCITPQFVW